MTYPPEGCRYQVAYREGATKLYETFQDEFDFGDWLKAKEAAGELSRFDKGLEVFCLVDNGGRQPIDVDHPRLTRGRLEKRPPARS